jgi:GcrA cell cycle regulator
MLPYILNILNVVSLMSWTQEKVNKLKELWGKGSTASQIAEIIGGVSRNAVIGKAHRLNLSQKIKTRSSIHQAKTLTKQNLTETKFKGRRSKFKSLILDKNFEPAKNLTLEELTEDTCKYMEGNPNEKEARFCGRKNVEKFSYCPLHLMIVFQPKGKKEDVIDKNEDVPKFIAKKIKSA